MIKIIKDSGCCKEKTIKENQNTVNNNSYLIISSQLQPVIFITRIHALISSTDKNQFLIMDK